MSDLPIFPVVKTQKPHIQTWFEILVRQITSHQTTKNVDLLQHIESKIRLTDIVKFILAVVSLYLMYREIKPYATTFTRLAGRNQPDSRRDHSLIFTRQQNETIKEGNNEKWKLCAVRILAMSILRNKNKKKLPSSGPRSKIVGCDVTYGWRRHGFF